MTIENRLNKKISTKALAITMLIMSCLALAGDLFRYFKFHYINFAFILSLAGIVGAILLLRKDKAGLNYALVWSVMQIVFFQFDGFPFSFVQSFKLSFQFNILIGTSVLVIGINFFAIFLLYLFLQKKKHFKK